MTDIHADLTDPQREAVTHTEGPLLVLAAAGSGKTRVITRRIAHLVGMGVPPWSICALTFTNKAAGEMRERVESILVGDGGDERRVRGLTVMTFHALSARLLRRFAEVSGIAGLKPDYTIYDSADQTATVKRVLKSLDLSTKNWPPGSVKASISKAKNDLMDADAFAAHAMDFATKQVARIYAGYEQSLRRANAIDFDDLLLMTAKLLRDNAEVRRHCQERWQYLMIDEYQDTNHAQFLIASLLAGEGEPGGVGPNICVVGDPDQAIYSWRGADISNILEFEDRYPKAKVIALGENFRSTEPILHAADILIKKNTSRKDKPLFTKRPGGRKPEVVLCRDERHEAELVADWFQKHAEDGIPWRDMAVFYRTNALSRVIEDALRSNTIPYTIARGTAFYEREEVKHALAYLRVVANQADDVSLGRIINMPTRGIGKTTLIRVADEAASRRCPVYEVMCNINDVGGLSARAISAIQKFTAMMSQWTGAGTFLGASVPTSLHELVERVVRESGLERHFDARAATSGLASDAERLDNLAELVSSAKDFEDEFDVTADPAADLPDFDLDDSPFDIEDGTSADEPPPPPLLAMLRAYLESVALVADADTVDPDNGAVTLMTLHAAKGLEFPAVAMIGLEQGMLPHSRAADSQADLEEERRLAFVGITRAMRDLVMTSARYRTIRGITERMIPSQFIDELGSGAISFSDQAGGDDYGRDNWDERQTNRSTTTTPVSRVRPGSTAASLPVGCTVRHPQFGVGTVLSIQSGVNARAQVKFKQVGIKTLILEYARLTRVDE